MFALEQKRAILEWHLARQKWLSQSWDRWESWYCGDSSSAANGDMGDYANVANEAEEFRIDTNYMYAFIDTSNAILCPSNPQVNIRAYREDLEDAAESREGLINSTFKRGGLDTKLRRAGMYTSLNGEALCKTTWRPAEQRIVYQMLSPRVVFVDHSVPWEDCRYIIEVVPYTKQEFEARLADGTFKMEDGREPSYGQIPTWMDSQFESKSAIYSSSVRDTFERILVYEFHDLTVPDVTWMIDGHKEPLKVSGRPYRYTKNPYSRLLYNENPKDHGGLPDAKLIEKSLDKLNEIDQLELMHAFSTIPKTVVDDNAVDDPEDARARLRNAAGPWDIVNAEFRDNKGPSDWLGFTQMPSQLPAFDKMRDRTEFQLEYTLGFPKQQRGAVSGADTATEVAVTDANSRTRNGARAALMKKFVREIAMNTLALYREFMPADAEVPVSGRDGHSSLLVDRVSLSFGAPGEEMTSDQMFAEEWFFDYDVSAATPSENDRSVQLQRTVPLIPIFMGDATGSVDKSALLRHLGKLADIPHSVVRKAPLPQAPQALPGQPGQPGFAGQSPTIPQGGSLPPGLDQQHEAMIPAEARGMASPPKIEV